MVALWGCMPEITKDCQDMTNASSTYLGIVIGALIGGVITWWVYNRQNKTAKMQDKTLNKIADLEQLHIRMLERIEALDENHDRALRSISEITEKLQKTLKNTDETKK